MDTTMQVIVTLAGSARGIPTTWTNFEVWRRISRLVDEYTEAKTDLEAAEMRYSPKLQGLTAHRARIQSLMQRLETAADYYGNRLEFDPEAPEEYNSAVDIIDTLTEAVVVIESRLHPIEADITVHRANVDRALTALLEQLEEINSGEKDDFVDTATGVVDFEITEDIVLPNTLDIIENELAEFDEKYQADKQEDLAPEVFRTDPEIIRREQVEVDLLNAFADRKSRQRQLEAAVWSKDMEQELGQLENQIQELGHELALLGVPIKDNSIVQSSVAYGPSSVSAIETTRHENPEIDYWAQTVEEQDQAYDLSDVQLGLFDGFDVEKPNACMDPEETLPPTRAEIQAMAEKLQSRVYDWMDSIDDEGDLFQEPGALNTEDLCETLDSLAGAAPQDSVTRILAPARFSSRQLAVLESRQRAWAVQLSRDRKETALRIEAEDSDIERPPGYKEWLE